LAVRKTIGAKADVLPPAVIMTKLILQAIILPPQWPLRNDTRRKDLGRELYGPKMH
jgi:hypothetical protein